mgnify:CR=1 FL=1
MTNSYLTKRNRAQRGHPASSASFIIDLPLAVATDKLDNEQKSNCGHFGKSAWFTIIGM